ncbi:MAG TPA: RDD family protein [Cytophagales bacterium]|nr:RDD family protein [Cytophagales bacterium]
MRRLSAFLIDTFLIFLIELIILVLFEIELLQLQLFTILIAWIYYAVMESSDEKASVGKKLLAIQVTDLKGNKLSLAKATIRYISKYASFCTLLIGFLMAAFTPRKQALHDIISGSLVVNQINSNNVGFDPKINY